MTLPVNLAAQLTAAANALAATVGTDDLLLRMQDDGTFVYGPDDVEVEEGSTWAVAPTSLRMGYQAWSRVGDRDRGKTLLGETTAGLGEEPIHISDLNPDLAWDEVAIIYLACVSGEDKGTQVRYKTSSVGGRRVIEKIFREIAHRAAQGEAKIVPICTLESDSYRNKKFNRTIYNPVFNAKSWVTLDAVEMTPSDDDEHDAAALPPAAAHDNTSADDDEPAAPTRRRRRSV